jgi:hypothetical protein
MSLSNNEVGFIESLKDTDTLPSSSENNLQVKLIYILLEEMAAARKEAKQTNRLLIEIADSLKTTNKYLGRLSKTIMFTKQDECSLRVYKAD